MKNSNMKKFKNTENFRKIAWVLVIVGGLNRGLLGLLNFNIVALIFGYGFFGRVIYVIVGLATVYILMYPEKKKTGIHTLIRK